MHENRRWLEKWRCHSVSQKTFFSMTKWKMWDKIPNQRTQLVHKRDVVLDTDKHSVHAENAEPAIDNVKRATRMEHDVCKTLVKTASLKNDVNTNCHSNLMIQKTMPCERKSQSVSSVWPCGGGAEKVWVFITFPLWKGCCKTWIRSWQWRHRCKVRKPFGADFCFRQSSDQSALLSLAAQNCGPWWLLCWCFSASGGWMWEMDPCPRSNRPKKDLIPTPVQVMKFRGQVSWFMTTWILSACKHPWRRRKRLRAVLIKCAGSGAKEHACVTNAGKPDLVRTCAFAIRHDWIFPLVRRRACVLSFGAQFF